jgi:hypothetical protein
MTKDQHTLATHMLSALESPGEQFEERGHLSERQMEILERVYAEKTA